MPDNRKKDIRVRLTDEDIERIARDILEGARANEHEHPSEHILSQSRELPAADEERVSNAIEGMFAARRAKLAKRRH